MRKADSIFSGSPDWRSRTGLIAAVILTSGNLGVTLRFFAEQSLTTQPALSFNWTAVSCFGSGILLTPLAIVLTNSLRGIKNAVRRTLVLLNVIPFATLVSPIIDFVIHDLIFQ